MSTPFITSKEARDAFDDSRKWYRPYDDPLQEFERLQRGRPSDKIDPALPRVVDSTLAAINQEQPKRIIQQIPTGLVVSKEHPEFAAIGNYLVTNKLIPMSQRMGSEIQKAWSLIGKAGTYGSATTYCYFTSINGQMYVEWILPYVKDVYGEKGKPFMPDSNIRFMRSWYQKSDIKAIIAKEKSLQDKNKDYTSDWDLRMLANLLDASTTRKDSDILTPAEREKGGDSGGYEIIHAFQNGKDAEFYSFSPQYEDGKTFRTKVNKDPRGRMPLDDMYWNIDHSNPRGRGQIELSGGIQNVMDQQLQSFVFDSVYNQQPALKVWGNVDKASLKIRTNALWDMGANKNTGDVERDQIDNTSIANFVPNMQFLQSKIYNLNSSNDNSIGAASGDVNQSKTQAGVQAQQAKLGVSDNYIRKQFEEAWGNMTETRLNIFLAEMTGSATVKVDGDDLKAIQDSPASQYLNEKGMLTIPYKQIEKVSFEFQVDAASSEIKADADNAEKLEKVYNLISQDPDPAIQQKKIKILKLWIDEIGAEGTDDLFPELNQKDVNGMPAEQQPQQPAQPDPAMIQQMVEQAVQQIEANKPQDDPLLKVYKDLPEDVKQQLIQKYGYQTQVDSPVERKLDIDAQEALRTAEQHEVDNQREDIRMTAEQAQNEFNNSQADRSSTLSETQALMSHAQADRQQTAAEKQAELQAKQKQLPAGVSQ